MDDQVIVDEIVVELNPGGATVWRARVDALNLVVEAGSPAEARVAAVRAVMAAGVHLSDDLVVRIRFGTRQQRLDAGWVPSVEGTAP